MRLNAFRLHGGPDGPKVGGLEQGAVLLAPLVELGHRALGLVSGSQGRLIVEVSAVLDAEATVLRFDVDFVGGEHELDETGGRNVDSALFTGVGVEACRAAGSLFQLIEIVHGVEGCCEASALFQLTPERVERVVTVLRRLTGTPNYRHIHGGHLLAALARVLEVGDREVVAVAMNPNVTCFEGAPYIQNPNAVLVSGGQTGGRRGYVGHGRSTRQAGES